MLFRKKKEESGIFDGLPVFEAHPSTQRVEIKKRGRRAMQIPTTAANPDISADQLLTNTGKRREEWLELIFTSDSREAKQKDISLWLQNNHKVQKWWANSIALSYLQWREAPKTNSAQEPVLRLALIIPTTVPLTFSILKTESSYGETFNRFLKQVPNEKLTLSFSDETRATISFRTHNSGCEILIEHEFIEGSENKKERNKYWNGLVLKVIQQVSR
ncbi:MAG: hypothetical protein WCG32_04245 [Actinomycetes bacterium]